MDERRNEGHIPVTVDDASGTKAYKGVHGKDTESGNASYTLSTLRGTVWR